MVVIAYVVVITVLLFSLMLLNRADELAKEALELQDSLEHMISENQVSEEDINFLFSLAYSIEDTFASEVKQTPPEMRKDIKHLRELATKLKNS